MLRDYQEPEDSVASTVVEPAGSTSLSPSDSDAGGTSKNSTRSCETPALMVEAPFQFQAHAILAFLLLAFWPFTRLVHVLSAPLDYLTRPYIVYRTRDDKRALGSRATQRGWDRVGTAKK